MGLWIWLSSHTYTPISYWENLEMGELEEWCVKLQDMTSK